MISSDGSGPDLDVAQGVKFGRRKGVRFVRRLTLKARPGAYILLGQSDDTHQAMVHNPAYDFNDRLIPLAVNVLSAAVSQGV